MSAVALCVRLVADDLTGALDAASPFARAGMPLPVTWHPAVPAELACAGHSLGTRDLGPEEAGRRMAEIAARWWAGFDGCAFHKVDSVWRGNPAAEIAAAIRHGGFNMAIVAPAFPQMGRLTENGRQFLRTPNTTIQVADLLADLREAGLAAACEADADETTQAVVCDALDDQALQQIVARHAVSARRLLWCGSAGLANALAVTLTGAHNDDLGFTAAETGKVHVLVGTRHPVTQAQAEAVAALPEATSVVICLPEADATPACAASAGIVLTRFEASEPSTPEAVIGWMRPALAHWAADIAPPALAVVTGGETLLALSDALGADALIVVGDYVPGFPFSHWAGGLWSGRPLISKSGGFGAPGSLAAIATAFTSGPSPEPPTKN